MVLTVFTLCCIFIITYCQTVGYIGDYSDQEFFFLEQLALFTFNIEVKPGSSYQILLESFIEFKEEKIHHIFVDLSKIRKTTAMNRINDQALYYDLILWDIDNSEDSLCNERVITSFASRAYRAGIPFLLF